MPELIALYEDHADYRDQFEVFAVHDKSVKSFAELDEKLPKIKEHYWQGKDLPFPVLLDATGETGKLYGVHSYPTGILIDPDGKLVGEAEPADLEAKLPPLPVAKKWARRRDVLKNVFWSFEPSKDTLKTLVLNFTHWTNCDIDLDADAVEACGLTPDGPLPGVLVGGPVTLGTSTSCCSPRTGWAWRRRRTGRSSSSPSGRRRRNRNRTSRSCTARN